MFSFPLGISGVLHDLCLVQVQCRCGASAVQVRFFQLFSALTLQANCSCKVRLTSKAGTLTRGGERPTVAEPPALQKK